MTKINQKVKVVEGISENEIPDYIFESQQPLILKGLVKNWPLTQLGLTDTQKAIAQLIDADSQQVAPVYYGQTDSGNRLGYISDCTSLNFEIKSVNLTQVLQELANNLDNPAYPLRYIASNVLQIHFPDIFKNNQLSFDSPYFKNKPMQPGDPLTGIWIGNRTLSPCHWDAQCNIACCVVGHRKFTLFPPSQIENLYPGPLELTPGGQSITLVDFDNPDFERFPKYKNAIQHGQIAELEPGDAIFIPCMWWHQVEAINTFNVLINYWWNPFEKIRGQAMPVLEHAILSLRDRPTFEKQAWKYLFDYYIFGDDQVAGEHIPADARGKLGKIDTLKARQLRALLINKLNR